MTTTATKVQKTSDIVFENLKKQGFSKYFNWIDYRYFRKLAETQKLNGETLADRITFYFLTYNNEQSDFADYEF